MNLATITDSVRSISKEAGAFIRKERISFRKEKVELKGKSDLVSYVDKETELFLARKLATLLPEAGFLTEEKTRKQEKKEYTWIIDPLDGTTNFVHDLPNYCVSVALAKGDEVIAGVIYEVVNDECFSAFEGGGALLNDEKIYVAPEKSIGECVFATGFPIHNFERINEYLGILNELMKNTHGLRRMGSAAADMAYVACGRYGGFFEYNLNPWDVAAGVIIVKEAGGTITDFSNGDNYLFGREMVAGGAVHPELIQVIQKHWK